MPRTILEISSDSRFGFEVLFSLGTMKQDKNVNKRIRPLDTSILRLINRSSRRILLVGLCLLSTNAFSETIEGRISLTGKHADEAEISDVIVYFEPEKRVLATPLDTPYQIKMKGKAYHPRVSAIPLGSQIQISNHDSILHNAFSPSRSNPFDLGLYGKSDGKIHQFKHAGVVRIFCNVHFRMVAYVLVLDTPFYTNVDHNGFFSLANLPSGKGVITIWHERAKRVLKRVELPLVKDIQIELPITKRRIPEHKNKSGRSYKKKRRSRRY